MPANVGSPLKFIYKNTPGAYAAYYLYCQILNVYFQKSIHQPTLMHSIQKIEDINLVLGGQNFAFSRH